MGGFECAYALGEKNKRMDLLADTKHDIYCAEDYRLLKDVGIYTVREGLSWNQIDKNGNYDFSRFEKIMKTANDEGIQIIWDLNHFDYPEDIDPFSKEFITRFAKYAAEAVRIIRKYEQEDIYIVPINEISYFAWVGAEVGRWAPYKKDQGYEFKKQLAAAAIEAIKSIRKIDTRVKFIHVDPLLRRIPNSRPTQEVLDDVALFNVYKWQTWDILYGKLEPQLGGNPDLIDAIGVNYYYFNQERVLNKKDDDGRLVNWGIGWKTPHRISFALMLKEVWERYKKPLIITETGGWGDHRWKWWRRMLKEIMEAEAMKLPIIGVCAYPIIDRPDWELGHLTNSGLWDFLPDDKTQQRIPHEKTIGIIMKYIKQRVKNEGLEVSYHSK